MNDKLVDRNNEYYPAIIVAIFIVLSFIILVFAHILKGLPIIFLDYFDHWSHDYRDYIKASTLMLQGSSPYSLEWYITTPLPTIFFIPFLPLGPELGKFVYLFLSSLAVFLSYFYIYKGLNLHSTSGGNLILLSGAFVILFSYPFYFLAERGNLEGFVFLFLIAGLIISEKFEKQWLGGFLITFAVGLKLYPIIILIPILIFKRYRLFFRILFWLAVLTLSLLPFIPTLGENFVFRTAGMFRFSENGSILNSMMALLLLLKSQGLENIITLNNIASYSYILYSILFFVLSLNLFIISKNKNNHFFLKASLMYFPFMVIIPQNVFHYEYISFIFLIPLVCNLWGQKQNYLTKNSEPKDNKKLFSTNLFANHLIFFIMIIGIGFSQWQSIATFFLTSNPLSFSIPNFGALCFIFGILSFTFMNRETKFR